MTYQLLSVQKILQDQKKLIDYEVVSIKYYECVFIYFPE